VQAGRGPPGRPSGLTGGAGRIDHRPMRDEVIDLGEYARRKEEEAEPVRATFAIWGGEGERSRFALPLWRAAYLASVSRAGLVWEGAGGASDALEPFVVLDLGEEPARTRFPVDLVESVRMARVPPVMEIGDEGGVIFLGERDERRWYMVLCDPVEEPEEAPVKVREDLHFLAGECAGLLFHRGLESEA